jgi:hypothetical protein
MPQVRAVVTGKQAGMPPPACHNPKCLVPKKKNPASAGRFLKEITRFTLSPNTLCNDKRHNEQGDDNAAGKVLHNAPSKLLQHLSPSADT